MNGQTRARFCLGATLLLAAASAVADVKETEEFTFEVDRGARLSLENINGSIEITGGSGSKVDIVARKKAGKQEYMDDLRVVIDADSDYVRIETRHPDSEGGWFKWGNNSSGSVSYELTVPADMNLDAIETVNGSVRAEFETLGDGQRVNAEAVNGKIVLVLPANASARIEAETVNGSIDADDFGLEAEKGFVGRDLSGRIGDGDARISLDTVNGSIRINKR